MKDTEDIDVPIVFDQVRNPEVPVEQDTHLARRDQITVAHLGKGNEILRPLVDSLNGSSRGLGIIGGNVLEDVLEPALGFGRPPYFCHERMRRSISSFEIARFESESARPRSTIT